MNDSVIQPGSSEEAKANRNLAIWVGVLGAGVLGLFYVLFFAIMIIRPGLMFKLFPTLSITNAAISDGNRTYLLLQKIDMSTIDRRQNSQPEIKHFIAALAGTKPGAKQEIPAYEHVSGANNRLLFVSKGSYRIYDGSRWVEERSEAIGKDPRGIIAPAGLYVLSSNESGPQLSLIEPGKTVSIPLPAEYLACYEKGGIIRGQAGMALV